MLKKYEKTMSISTKREQPNGQSLSKSLEDNISLIKGIFLNNETLIDRRFQNKYLDVAKCCVIYIWGMVDTEILNKNIIEPILYNNLTEGISKSNLLKEIQYKVLATSSVNISNDIDTIISSLVEGDTIFLLDGYDEALIISSEGWQTRSITEPESAKVVRGPREGFTESIIMNLTMIRRRIKDPGLKMKFKEIGKRTRTKTCICYIEELTLQSIIDELEKRLDSIDIDGIIDSGYIQELIRDAPFSPFETVGYSERPDVIASKILEGRIALFVDGSPFVLTVPFIFVESTQASEDYYNNFIFASFNRFVRATSAIVSISIPAIYLAITTFHQEMLPTPLLLSISASRKDVPFPTSLSMFIMLLIFDILREAGTRMPTPIGQAVNIVGTLVLGEAAVEAKLVSAPVIIVTALSGILTLLNINLIGSVIILRNFLLLGGSFLGIYGVIFHYLIIIIHLMNIRSFGIPYMLNVTTLKDHNSQDVWIRAPWWTMTLRPKIMGMKNLFRQPDRKSKGK